MNDVVAPLKKPKKLNIDLAAQTNKTFDIDPSAKRISRIPVSLIAGDPNQPRKRFDKTKLQELSENIKDVGLIQPIHVRVDPSDRDRYLVVAGERRFRACKLAGFSEIDAIVIDGKVEQIQLIENIQREDLSPLEEANALKRYQEQFNLTQGDLAKHIGKKRTTVVEILSITSLPTEIQMQLEDFPNISKSQLITLAKEKDKKKRDHLWFLMKTGGNDDSDEKMTVRDARAVRKGQKKESDLSPTEKALKSLENTAKRFAQIDDAMDDGDVADAKKTIREINKLIKEKAAL